MCGKPPKAYGCNMRGSASKLDDLIAHRNLLETELKQINTAIADESKRLLHKANDSRGIDLTERERQVLALVRSGAKSVSIGIDLSITERTVTFHIANLLKKFGVQSRGEL